MNIYKMIFGPAEKVVEPIVAIGEEIDSEDPIEKRMAVWDFIIDEVCPACGKRDGFLKGPKGGLAINIKCADDDCQQRFWITGYREFGACYL